MTANRLPAGQEPDLDRGRRFLELHPPPGRVLLCAVTGSHHYGFPSPDSDLDLKGIHLAPTRRCLGLGAPAEAHDRLEVFDGQECDLTTNEARQALSLLLRGNGNLLERILSPYQVVETPELGELRDLALEARSRAFFGHYAGYFRGMCREHEKEAEPRAKSLLYSYRVALTGIHLLRTGELEANLRVLAPRYGHDDALELIEHKTSTAEKVALDPAMDAHHRGRWPRLEREIEEARDESELPERAPNRERCEQWLVELRVRELEGAVSPGP